jgi:hypothetical protein
VELDFRNLNVKKLFDFSKEEENLIFEVYDKLFEIYDIAVIEIKASPFHEFNSAEEIPLFTPKIGYFITDKKTKFFLSLYRQQNRNHRKRSTRNNFIRQSANLGNEKIKQ